MDGRFLVRAYLGRVVAEVRVRDRKDWRRGERSRAMGVCEAMMEDCVAAIGVGDVVVGLVDFLRLMDVRHLYGGRSVPFVKLHTAVDGILSSTTLLGISLSLYIRT